MSKRLFLLLAVFVMASIAAKFPPAEKLAAEFLAAGVKQKYIDQFFDSQQTLNDHLAEAAAEEKKTGKKGLQDAAMQKHSDADSKMYESWPKEQEELLSGVIEKYVMA